MDTANISIADPTLLEQLADCKEGDEINVTLKVTTHTPPVKDGDPLQLEGEVIDVAYSDTTADEGVNEKAGPEEPGEPSEPVAPTKKPL